MDFDIARSNARGRYVRPAWLRRRELGGSRQAEQQHDRNSQQELHGDIPSISETPSHHVGPAHHRLGFCLIRAQVKRIGLLELRKKQLHRERAGVAFVRELAQIVVNGETPSPGSHAWSYPTTPSGVSGTS